MALYNAFDKFKSFSELAVAAKIDGVLKTPSQRRALARAGLGIGTDAQTYTAAQTFDDITVGGDATFDGTADFDAAVDMSGAGTVTLGTAGLVRTSRKLIIPVGGNAQVGATGGWVITGTNEYSARLPQSQTNSTLVIPILGLEIGDTLTGVSVIGQVESAGNNVTMTLSVRKLTAAAADLTDAEIGTDTSGTLTADTLLDDTTGVLKVTGLTEVLAELESLYVLITATTAASTDIAIQAIMANASRA